MPTIEQLEPVIVAADDDSLPVSQGGVVRRVSRAQFLAGTQTSLSLSSGLLGRASPGFGPPEQIGIGGSLLLTNGVLSSPPRFSVSALPQSAGIGSSDLVAVSKGGQDTAVPVSALLSAAGADVSGQIVKANLGNARKLSDWTSDALTVEAFGAIGDGQSDDSAAFARALASGLPLRLGPKTYRVDGQWTITVPATLLGIPGVSTIRRVRQTGGAWITISAASFVAAGIDFDAGGLQTDSWAVQVSATCTATVFDSCTFANANGPTLGSGMTIQARDGLSGPGSSHTIRDCTFRNNAVHGLWIQAACGASIVGCSAFQNGSYGFCLDFNDPLFSQVIRHSAIIGCRSWSNQRGISVGNYNETNLEPPLWGPKNPDARDILVADNICFANSTYGIAAAGLAIQVKNNLVSVDSSATNSSGILFNASQSRLGGNAVVGSGQFGIDGGGCVDSEFTDNLINGFQVGINAGGSSGVRVSNNRVINNVRGITAFQVETDGAGNNFGIPCSNLQIFDNVIELPSSSAAGILLFDGVQNAEVRGNQMTCSDATEIAAAISVLTDQARVSANSWNGATTHPGDLIQIGALTYLQVPEIVDEASLPTSAISLAGILGKNQFNALGKVTFIRVTQGGTGYSNATVNISGSGNGAQAKAYIRGGVIIGFALLAGGTGYGAADTQVSIQGDGQGAAAVPFVGLPTLEGRRLTLVCNTAVALRMDGVASPFDNWTGGGLSIPARSEVVCVGTDGRWRAVAFSATDYLAPAADGSVALRSVSGDVTVQPRGAGHLRLASDNETGGFIISLGRGSPEGVVTATPGSDYRNLNGGAGQTLWLKQSGVGNTGWVALG